MITMQMYRLMEKRQFGSTGAAPKGVARLTREQIRIIHEGLDAGDIMADIAKRARCTIGAVQYRKNKLAGVK